MQAILNIELDEKVDTGGIPDRYNTALREVRKYFTRSVAEIQIVEYTGPDGDVQECTAVVMIEFHSNKDVVLMALDLISTKLNQDCVAVLFGDGDGRLVGPGSTRWGNFKLEYFKQPSIVELFKEAA